MKIYTIEELKLYVFNLQGSNTTITLFQAPKVRLLLRSKLPLPQGRGLRKVLPSLREVVRPLLCLKHRRCDYYFVPSSPYRGLRHVVDVTRSLRLKEACNRSQSRLVIIDLRQVFIKQHRLRLITTILLLLLRKDFDIWVFCGQSRQFRAMFLHSAHLILVLPDFFQRQP